MKNITKLLALVLLLPFAVNANIDVTVGKKKAQVKPQGYYKTEAGDCAPPVSQTDMDINNVRTRLLNGGDLWWDLSVARYEVPKANPPGSTQALNMLFAGAIWVSGVDAGGNLKVAAMRYRQVGYDYWAGPLDNKGEVTKTTCVKWDRHFNVLGTEIEQFQKAFEAANGTLAASAIAPDVLRWPGKGNPVLAADGFEVSSVLAPFRDVDGNGIYDPTKGDFPTIYASAFPAPDTLGAYGDQMIFWVMNDAGNIHTESSGQGIGIQVNTLAFAFKTTDEINNMTFYRYNITNKSSLGLRQTFISQWSDPDLGNSADDYVGCDVGRRLAFVYNGDNFDEAANGVGGYGTQLPLGGIVFFEGPKDTSGNELGLTSFVYFNNEQSGPRRDPGSAVEYRNYMTAKWLDGTPFTEGGNGYAGTVVTNYCFPGNPIDGSQWSECYPNGPSSQPNAKGDRRMVQTSGPFLLQPGLTQDVTIGVIFVRPPGVGVGTCPDLSFIRPASDKAQGLFNQKFRLTNGPDAPTLDIRELDREIIINLRNLPGSNNYGEAYKEVIPAASVLYPGDTTDRVKYVFQGYKLYQVRDSRVSATDVEDPNKSLLIAQVDIKDGVGRIIEFRLDQSLNLYVPVERVASGDGTDKGIQNSFRLTTDKFAPSVDENRLVNHKTYFYTAIAYGYNNFATFNINRPDSTQPEPFKAGRKNFKIYSALPHKTEVRNEGTVLNAQFGDGVEVRRIEGAGNGGNAVDLTDETIGKILSSAPQHYTDTLVYKKGKDPIKFKVVDPMKIQEADWEVRFKLITDSTISKTLIRDTNGIVVKIDSAAAVDTIITWVLHKLNNDGTVADVINSEIVPYFKRKLIDYKTGSPVVTIDERTSRPYEQYIFTQNGAVQNDYGFSLTFGYPVAVYTNRTNGKLIFDYLTSSVENTDPTDPWLSFLKDEGEKDVANWIRSGSLLGDLSGAWNPNRYRTGIVDTAFTDPNKNFDKMAAGSWAPYALTSNFSMENNATCRNYEIGNDIGPIYINNPGFKWRNYTNTYSYTGQQGQCNQANLLNPMPQNNLEELISVDIVITPDTSKWSRCIVFETGEESGTNQGADIAPNGRSPRKGQIRRALSKNKDGSVAFDLNQNFDFVEDTGRGWFPGYAINVENGERLNIAFGEASDYAAQRGNDMFWNPTATIYSTIVFNNRVPPREPFFGGKHFIYVMNTRYDEGKEAQEILLSNYNVPGPTNVINSRVQALHRNLLYTAIPHLNKNFEFKELAGNKIVPPSEVKVKIRVERPFTEFATRATFIDANSTGGLPRYQFSTKGLAAVDNQKEVAKNALDLIRVVPNPYLAYSTYETSQFDTRVKIINLPNKCEINIFTLDGTFIRRYSRSIDIDPSTNSKVDISDGAAITDGVINLDSSIDWDLKNDRGISVSSGVYIIHIKSQGLGERTQKVFLGMRPPDISNF